MASEAREDEDPGPVGGRRAPTGRPPRGRSVPAAELPERGPRNAEPPTLACAAPEVVH